MSKLESIQMGALEETIQTLEEGYEFLLAFAAQGRESDQTAGQTARSTLQNMSANIERLQHQLEHRPSAFSLVALEDSRKVQSALTLIMKLPRINSELIDNLNASVHLRALLTDVFIISEASRIARNFKQECGDDQS